LFEPLPPVPDHPSVEASVLRFWDDYQVFRALMAQNADGPRFSFIDGPVTANKALAVHTCWGRTLKDVFQRYKALRGFHQRYQNGFDCQGLWIEVGVERELGLNSKREIEEYGLDEFARRCREVVIRSARDITDGSIRLGQWMDWENSYFTFSDTNISYIWGFLKRVHEQGRLVRGHRATEWCPRCGTSISAHELIGSYIDQEDPSLWIRFPLLDRPGEALIVWTTTPWTLPANVAAAVSPTSRYGLRAGEWRAVERVGVDESEFDLVVDGSEMVGWRYEGPFDGLRAEAEIEHHVIAWDAVSMDDGTGIVHIAPGCGGEDFQVGIDHGLPLVAPVDEAGLFYADFGWLAGEPARASADRIIDDLRSRGRLADASTIVHRYPECWRCHTPLIFRISDDWFIQIDDALRAALRAANETVEWNPEYMGKRMDDWLVNMGDWNISRRRYYGLPLPFYPCTCGHLTVVGSKAELEQLAVDSTVDLPELHRPWIDRIRVRCRACGDVVQRIAEVGDVWLDAGIVPFSTLGWNNAEHISGGYATGAAEGLTGADLPDHRYWESWFPAGWVSEMREQIRLWFYSQLCISVVLTGRAPFEKVLGYEKMLDETGREMHGSWGNMIDADEAFACMGADVMRWQFCQQQPSQNLLFGFGIGNEIKRKLLTLWNSASFWVQYANVAGYRPEVATLEEPGLGEGATSLDRWLVARTAALLAEAEAAYEAYLTVDVIRAFEHYVDDLSNWYIRRSRRRFWNGDVDALGVLWWAIVTALRTIAPVIPFLAEHLYQRLVAAPLGTAAPQSIFLARWPQVPAADPDLLDDVARVREVIGLGRQARAKAKVGLRQPLSTLVVEGVELAPDDLEEIASELRVKSVLLGSVDTSELRVRPNLKVLGPRLGDRLPLVREALQASEFVERDDGFEVAGILLAADEVLVERTQKAGWAVAASNGVTVAFDLKLDDELRRESRVLNLIHHVNGLRKEAGLELTDRIRLVLPADAADLLSHADWIADEVLAVDVQLGDVAEASIEVAEGSA